MKYITITNWLSVQLLFLTLFAILVESRSLFGIFVSVPMVSIHCRSVICISKSFGSVQLSNFFTQSDSCNLIKCPTVQQSNSPILKTH